MAKAGELEYIVDSEGRKKKVILPVREYERLRELAETVKQRGLATDDQSRSALERHAFLRLPVAERRAILRAQADEISQHYQQGGAWREADIGDFFEY